MPTFGSFESERVIRTGGMGRVCAARSTQRRGQFALRILEPDTTFTDAETIKTQVRGFLEQARLQEQVSADSSDWAPIHEVGRTPTGAYYATDLYTGSVESLINGRVVVTGRALHRIVSAVVRGLCALDTVANRPHGNLKSSNVLIATKGDIGRVRAAISDPLPNGLVDAEVDRARDYRAVGEVIYSLVLHQSVPGSGSIQVSMSGEWTRLGVRGEGWQRLCQRLLDPGGGGGEFEELAELLAIVDDLKEPSSTGRRLAVGTVGIAVIGTAIGLAVWQPWTPGVTPEDPGTPVVTSTLTYAEVQDEWDTLRGRWFWMRHLQDREAVRRLTETYSRELVGAMLSVKPQSPREVVGARTFDSDNLIADLETNFPLSRQAEIATAILAELERQKPVIEAVAAFIAEHEDAAAAAASHEWTNIADAMASSSQTLQDVMSDPKAPAGLFEPIEAMLRQRAWLDAHDELLAQVDGTTIIDEAVPDFPDLAHTRAAITHLMAELPIDAAASTAVINRCEAMIDRVRVCLETRWRPPTAGTEARRVDAEYFNAQAGFSLDSSTASVKNFEDWCTEVVKADYDEPTDRPTAGWAKVEIDGLKATARQARLACRDEEPSVADARDEAIVRLETQAADLVSLPYTRTTAGDVKSQQEAIAHQIRSMEGEFSQIRRECDQTTGAWLKEVTDRLDSGIATLGPALEPFYVAGMRSILENGPEDTRSARATDFEPAMRALDQQLGDRMPAWRTTLAFADQAPTIDRAVLVELLDTRTRNAAQTVFGTGAPTTVTETHRAAWTDRLREIDDWVEQVVRTVTTVVQIEEQINRGHGWEDAGVEQTISSLQGSLATLEPSLRPAFRRTLDPAEGLRQVHTMGQDEDRDGLVRWVTDDGLAPMVRWSAWKELGTLPPRADTIQTELSIEEDVTALLDGRIAPESRESLRQEFEVGRRERWMASAPLAIATEGRVAATFDAMPGFGLSLADLDVALQFDYVRAQCLEAVNAGLDDEALQARLTTLMSDLPGTDASRRLRDALVASFAEEGGISLDEVGPRRSGWNVVARAGTDDEIVDVSNNDGHSLAFRRVEMDAGYTIYMSTTEVTVGTVAAILNTVPGVVELEGFNPGQSWKPRRGSVTKADAWFSRDSNNRVDPMKRRSSPVLEHPMNNIRGAEAQSLAAAMGCRLPTAGEWATAAGVTTGGADVLARFADANVRDDAWLAQDTHVKDEASMSNLSSYDRDSGNQTWPGRGDDGAAYFREADTTSATFRDLVGNVAEFVLLTEGENVGPSQDDLGIIGESAISPPASDGRITSTPAKTVRVTRRHVDVGFRVVFVGGGSPLNKRVLEKLDEHGFQSTRAGAAP